MNFKDVVSADIGNVFLNISEFATEHIFNGRTIKCIIDAEKFQNKQKNGLISTEEGTFQEGFTLFVGENDLKIRPHPGEEMTLDGKTYEVVLSKFDMGIYEIDLARYEEI